MKDKFYMQSNKFEKLTLLLTKGFDEVLCSVIDGHIPFVKVDIAVVDKSGTRIFSYNNGSEVNCYIVDKEPLPHFIYAPGADSYPSSFPVINCDQADIDKKIKEVFKNREKTVSIETPKDMLSRIISLGELQKDVRVYAVLIGFSFQWNMKKMIGRLFEAYIGSWRNLKITNSDSLDLSSTLADAGRYTATRSIIHEACEQELLSHFYSKRQRNITEECLFDNVCNLSLLPYEGMTNQGVIGFASESKKDNCSLRFEEPIRFEKRNLREIRKLLEMTSEGMALVAENGYIVGITPVTSTRVKLVFKNPGKWEVQSNSSVILAVSGSFCSILPATSPSTLSNTYKSLFRANKDVKAIENIILSAKKQRHGTGLIVIPNARTEAKRLSDLKRAIAITPIDLCKNDTLTRVITAIDGALLVDQEGVCYAIGVIVDGEAVIEGSTARGARYNSLRNYIEWQYEKEKVLGLAVIISEDQTVDVYPSETRLRQLRPNVISNYTA